MDLRLASVGLNRHIVGFSVARIRCSPSCWLKAKPWNPHLIILITAGARQRSDKVSRLDDLAQGAQILRSIITEIAAHNPSGILLIAANPVDVLTYAAWKWSGFPSNRVIGFGTPLDTSRFRTVLAQHYSVAPENIHAYIIGEHGDSQVPILSSANISGMMCTHKAGVRKLYAYLREAFPDFHVEIHWQLAYGERVTT
jgi:malate/lactate dehydrogenase